MNRASLRRASAAALVFCICAAALAAPVLALEPQRPGGYACATAHPLATQACLAILAQGGNAVDAAVAASATIAVVEPTGSGIGGGGFWLLHRASDAFETFVDGRETAPASAQADMYLGADGVADPKRSRAGALSAAIPGEPAALDYLARRYGRLPLRQLLAPAIRHAREGFAVDAKLARAIAAFAAQLAPAARALLAPGGKPLAEGALLRQSDLARVLDALATHGAPGFYQGAVAQQLVAGVRAAGGIWTLEDLRRYRVQERAPIVSWFRDYRIVSAPPPSAGGVALAQILQQLEVLGWRSLDQPRATHLLIEAMRRAYRERATWLGDPDFVDVPVYRLAARHHAIALARTIDGKRATKSSDLPAAYAAAEGDNTSHLSVIDADGNRVAATLSINTPFGSGFVVPGTGVFLNNEMDDFAASVDASNAYGLVGSLPNRIAPGKRPLSSMSPTFVEGPRGLLVLGTPGGSRIITMVTLGLLAWIDGAPLHAVVARPRFHHQYLPDEVAVEPQAFDPAAEAALAALGHALTPAAKRQPWGNMQALSWDVRSGRLEAASDPRGVGAAGVVMLAPAAAKAR